MTWIRRLVLPVGLVLLSVVAAPAHATLLVRSDGNGLLVQDKNGLNDAAGLGATTRNGQTAYRISSSTAFDVFRFDRQVGCHEIDDDEVACDRNGPIVNIGLAGGNDLFLMSGAPIGTTSVAAASGDDFVGGHPGRDILDGGLGDDKLDGRAGNDSLEGEDGNDRLRGDTGNDTLRGKDGDDRLEGEDGNDTLEGASGSDALFGGLGVDILRGGTGNDFLSSKEPSGTGVADSIACGSGSDFLEADSRDVVPDTCERFEQSPVGETPHIRIPGRTLRVSPTGRVRVRLRCPRGVGSLGCRGSLRLALARARSSGSQSSRSRRVRYRIRAGRRKTVRLRLTRRDVRVLRRDRRRGRTRRGRLTSVERGRKGRKTTISSPRLTLRRR